jgi:hypothetical protein
MLLAVLPVYLVQEADEHLLLQARLGFIHLIDHLGDFLVRFLFVFGKTASNIDFCYPGR